jgi:hypothetical protein
MKSITSQVRTVFCHSNTGSVGSNPKRAWHESLLCSYRSCGVLISVQGLQRFRKPKKKREALGALAFVPHKKRKRCSSLLCSCISNCICFRQYSFYKVTLGHYRVCTFIVGSTVNPLYWPKFIVCIF